MFCFYLFILLHITSVYSSIQIIKVRENANVTMTCHFDTRKSLVTTNQLLSIPSLNKFFDKNLSDNIILWYKDETQVISVNSISNDPTKYLINQLNIHTYQLTIINVQLESSGLYKCQNFTAKEENHFQLNVIVPPSRLHLTASPQLPANDGTSVLFNCTSERAYPIPIFEWYKNDKLIQRSIGNQTDSTLFSSSIIFTLSLTPADHNHILRCQVSNEASIHETNIEVKLDVLFKPIINISWNQKEVSKTLTIIENTLEIIHCVISANPPVMSNIEWFKNDQSITGENDEELRINFTRLENIEKLTCRAKNAIGQSETNVNINILYKPKLSMIERVILNQGGKLILKCSIDANPLCHQIRWFHNEKELMTQSCTSTNKTQTLAEYIIDNVYRSHAGKYTCEVKNWLNTSSENRYEATSYVSTDVRIQYAPVILNSYKKLAVIENHDITTECSVDAYPKAEITWLGPSDQRLNSFAEENLINTTVISSVLHLPPSYSFILGLYRCLAKNDFGQHEFSIEFQRPDFPDPPNQLEAINITHSSFILHWQSGYDGGSDQLFDIILLSNHTDERKTSSNSIRFEDLQEKTGYIVKIRSKNDIGFSDYSPSLIIMTKECPFRTEDFPIIQRAYYTPDGHQIRFQLSQIQSPINHLCIQYYNNDETSSCIPLTSIQSLDDGLEINIEQTKLRLKLCLINQTDVCSRSVSIPTDIPLSNDSSELIVVITGGILGLCLVLGLIGLFICLRRQRRQKSKNGSTDTLKTNSDNAHTIPVRVSDTNSCLYYPANESRRSGALFYNDETTGVYSIQERKNSICFDSGMPSTTSNNSDSAGSQALSSSDSYDRSDGEYLVNGRISTNKIVISDRQETSLAKLNGMNDISQYIRGRENHVNISMNGRISSEEESGFSTPTKSHHGKKLVYEVVV